MPQDDVILGFEAAPTIHLLGSCSYSAPFSMSFISNVWANVWKGKFSVTGEQRYMGKDTKGRAVAIDNGGEAHDWDDN